MTVKKCAWPGCKCPVFQTGICGEHQLAIMLAVRFIISTCEEYQLTRKDAIVLGINLGPTITTKEFPHGLYEILESVPSQVAVALFKSLGSSERYAYSKAAKLRQGDKVPTISLVRAVVAGQYWVSVSVAAEQIGVSHRYLRHLIYEDRNESLMKLAITNFLAKSLLGFSKNTLTELETILEGVDKRRGR